MKRERERKLMAAAALLLLMMDVAAAIAIGGGLSFVWLKGPRTADDWGDYSHRGVFDANSRPRAR